jgi:hypothetical protein
MQTHSGINYNINLKVLTAPMSRLLKTPPKGPQYSTILHSIEVNVSTWVKDSHGLYDYEATEEFYKR